MTPGLKQNIFVKNYANTVSLLNLLLLNHGKRVLSGVLGRDDNVDTIRIAAKKRAIEIGADFNVYTDSSASAYWMEDRVLWSPGKSNFA